MKSNTGCRKKMNYISTRGSGPVSASKAILSGIAPDGGLYIPAGFRQICIDDIVKLNAIDIADRVLQCFLDDFTADEISECARLAFTGRFETEDITPLKKAGGMYFLELFRGPTAAFKDVALSVLPHLLGAAVRKNGVTGEVMILTATSGDTGKAALEAFRNVKGVRILVFYPKDGVSAVQKAQMTTQEGSNVCVAAVRGNFDDAQRGVKKIFDRFRGENLFCGRQVRFSSANSINIGRLAPQVFYYFKAYADLLNGGEIRPGEKVNFAVPTGNFGNILAGLYAKRMGLPVGTLICASNENNVLTDFIRTGVYDRRRELVTTVSPSMDILVSSNLERFLYMLCGDSAAVRCRMEDLFKKGIYSIPEAELKKTRDEFYGGFCTGVETVSVIRSVWENGGYLMDTHTAAAAKVYGDFKKERDNGLKTVILSTASPFKFASTVLHAIGGTGTDEFRNIEELCRLTGVPAPGCLTGLFEKPVRHRDTVSTEDMEAYTVRKAGEESW
jgi:threonine synthase